MRIENPRRYRIEGSGEWGIAEGLIYENVEKRTLSFDDFVGNPKYKAFYGLDFGFTDPTAFVIGVYDTEKIYVLKELYLTGTTNQVIANQIKKLGVTGEIVYCDAAEPKSIEELRKAGINARPAVKGPDSVLFGIQQLQNFKIIYDPSCANFDIEIQNYCWTKDRQGKTTDKPDHEFSHLMDALRYALAGQIKQHGHKMHSSNIKYLRRCQR